LCIFFKKNIFIIPLRSIGCCGVDLGGLCRTTVAVTGEAPYRSVLTHGFVLDGQGRKMSKSAGNVIDPQMIVQGEPNKKNAPIPAYGADVLRLWVAQSDPSKDVSIGPDILSKLVHSSCICFDAMREKYE
jgi:isoleucyl-tRNA synthetase